MKKTESKNETLRNYLFYFAIFILAVSLIIFFINITKITRITGGATGTANLTISSSTEINFTTSMINWSIGNVQSGRANATLDTSAGANNVTNGNWTGNTAGLVIENIGNSNVTLQINSGKNSSGFIGGTSPLYQLNITNIEASSCAFNDSYTTAIYHDANITVQQVCNDFTYNDTRDTIRIDVKVVIPSDARGGAKGDVITATATAL